MLCVVEIVMIDITCKRDCSEVQVFCAEEECVFIDIRYSKLADVRYIECTVYCGYCFDNHYMV